MSPSSSTRDTILDLAEAMLRERSFSAFSYQDIADRVGIRKASVYYHFSSKEKLGMALVERFVERLRSLGAGIAAASPVHKLELYFRSTRSVLEEGNRICAFGILSAEINALPTQMQRTVREMVKRQLLWLEQVLRDGREAGLFQGGPNVEEQASLLSASLQGALQIARASQDPKRFLGVERLLRDQILNEDGQLLLSEIPAGSLTPSCLNTLPSLSNSSTD